MFHEEWESEYPQTFEEILAFYAMVDAQTAGWTAWKMRGFGVANETKAEIKRPTQDHMFEKAIY